MPVSTTLPSMPAAVLRLLQVYSDPDVAVNEVVDILRTDPALSSRILKAANSSIVSAGRPTSELKRAAMLLGKKTVTTLALSFSLEDQSLADGGQSKLFQQYWLQSFVTGIASSVLAKKYGCVNADEAFVVGLLSRIGRLGALSFAGDEYTAAMNQSEQSGQEVDRVDIESLGASCEQLTQNYLAAWNLPDQFRDQIAAMTASADEDRAGFADTRELKSELQPGELFRLANAAGNLYVGENAGIALATLHELLEGLGPNSGQLLDEVMADILDEFSSYADMLDMPTDSIETAASLRDQAASQLIEITMLANQESQADQSQHSEKPTDASRVGDHADGSHDSTEQMHCEMDWLRRRVDDLARQLTIDPMTKVFNRQYFDRQLENVIAKCRTNEVPASLLFVDVNKFKIINDTYGHQAGDSVICTVANALASNVRKDDIVARYGGDEFVVLCQTNDTSGLDAQASRLSNQLATLCATHEGQKFPISLAIGGATGIPETASDFARRLLHEADLAMYEAKQGGAAPVVRILNDMESTSLETKQTDSAIVATS